jgi:uncharacterized protein
MGTHPIAGHYASRSAFKAGTFSKLGKVLAGGAHLRVTTVIIKGYLAVVELISNATGAQRDALR